MMLLYWVSRNVRDVVWMSYHNKTPWLGITILGLMALGGLFSAASVSAPFIYTLF